MKILFISYFYPPLAGPASLRNLKTVKYLSKAGNTIDVLTVGNIVYNYYDNGLLAESRQNRIIHIPSFDPMSILEKLSGKNKTVSNQIYHNTPERIKLFIRQLYPLDDKVLWLPNLYKAGKKALKDEKYDLLYVSCGPFSSAVAVRTLSKQFKVPYILEMRDYWTLLSDYNLQGTYLNRLFSHYTEKKLLQDASLIVTVSKGIAEDISKHFGSFLADKTFILYNGHDEEDFLSLPAVSQDKSKYTLSYFGALYAKRSLKWLLKALKDLQKENKLPPNFSLHLYGNYHIETLQEIKQSGIEEMVKIIPQLNHQEAISAMLSSDALLLLINSDSPKGTLTSKVFEYLRTGKPILALVPKNGEAGKLLQESGQNYICPMESVSAIKICAEKLFADREKELKFHYPEDKYERRKQVEELNKKLLSVARREGKSFF
ncbi:MAG TPA: glycosyltransferase [Candidatus Cloacimonas acidaminovorans]|nr:glycosyltransferase [Candidatus Cloacimonas acidaminovorans]